MWCGMYDMKKAIRRLEEQFDESSFKQALSKFGDVTFRFLAFDVCRFCFTINGQDITLIFAMNFKDRHLYVQMRDSIGNDGLANVVYTEFKKWLAAHQVDCLISGHDLFFVPNDELFATKGEDGDVLLTYCGEESKQIISMIQQIPIFNCVDRNAIVFELAKQSIFRNSKFLVTFSYSPKPCLAFLLTSEPTYKKEDLISNVYTRCFTGKDIATFFDWYNEQLLETKKVEDDLLNRFQSLSPAVSVTREQYGAVVVDNRYSYRILPFVEEFEYKYIAEIKGLFSPTFTTKEAAIAACVSMHESLYHFHLYGKELQASLELFGDKTINNSSSRFDLHVTTTIYKEQVSFRLECIFDDDLLVSYRCTFNQDICTYATLEEMKQCNDEQIEQFANKHRIRSLFKPI